MKHLPADSFTVQNYYMDTKRNNSEQFIKTVAEKMLDSIKLVDPDILVVSDDNAVKYIVEPNFSVLKMPIVFCGVNWTAKEYNLPRDQVTGILEILPVEDALLILKSFYPNKHRLLVLNENTTTARKEKAILDTLVPRLGFTVRNALVDDYEQWKNMFVEANQQYDFLYIPTHASIKGWNDQDAIDFVNQEIKIPVFTCEDFMMPYAILGVTKIAAEHGEWAAKVVKKLLSGTSPAAIEISKNKRFITWINPKLAEKTL